MSRNPIERALGVWSTANYRDVMLPGLGAVTCGQFCDAMADESLSRTGAVKVKALEWEERKTRLGTVWWSAPNPLGGLSIEAASENDKIAAQADYEHRILSALEPAAPEGQQPVAYRVHAPEDEYYGVGPDRLQFHPLSQHDLDNGYRQTPLYTCPTEQAVTEAMVEALRNIDAEAPAKEPRDDWTSTDLDEAFYEGKLRGYWEMAVYAREALTAALGAQTPPEWAVTDEMVEAACLAWINAPSPLEDSMRAALKAAMEAGR